MPTVPRDAHIAENNAAARKQAAQHAELPRKPVPPSENYPPGHNDIDRNFVVAGLAGASYEMVGNPYLEPGEAGRSYAIQQDRILVTEATNRDSRAVPEFLERAFDQIAAAQREAATPGGATANVAYVSKDDTLTVANAGDSRTVVLIRDILSGDITTLRMSKDHVPSDPLERARIEAEGGMVHKTGKVVSVNGKGASFARSFGDAEFIGITHRPDITQIDLSAEINDPSKEVFLVNSCDGVYNQKRVHEDDLATVAERKLGSGPSAGRDRTLAKAFGDNAIATGSGDNISVNVVKLAPGRTQDFILATFDGHGEGGEHTAQFVRDQMAEHAWTPAEAYRPRASYHLGIAVDPEQSSILGPNLEVNVQAANGSAAARSKHLSANGYGSLTDALAETPALALPLTPLEMVLARKALNEAVDYAYGRFDDLAVPVRMAILKGEPGELLETQKLLCLAGIGSRVMGPESAFGEGLRVDSKALLAFDKLLALSVKKAGASKETQQITDTSIEERLVRKVANNAIDYGWASAEPGFDPVRVAILKGEPGELLEVKAKLREKDIYTVVEAIGSPFGEGLRVRSDSMWDFECLKRDALAAADARRPTAGSSTTFAAPQRTVQL